MREPFDHVTNYHVYNRGVDKRTIFSDEWDFRRFYESMFLFNDENYRVERSEPEMREIQLASHEQLPSDRKPLVNIMAFCLRDNHFHLMLRQVADDGISRFLHRLGMGYAKYFNLRHNRTGRLFEGSFKAKPADFEGHLELLPRYIHLNALDGVIDWRETNSVNWKLARKILDDYPWSSHHLYAGNGQMLPVVDSEVVREIFPEPSDYWKYLTGTSLSDAERLEVTHRLEVI